MEGQPLRDHLESWERQTGRRHPKLADAPTIPVGCSILWNEFLTLHHKRGTNGFGPAPISESDIFYRQRNRRIALRPWEIKAIEAADREYMACRAEQHEAKK